jgi:hypothetical protein
MANVKHGMRYHPAYQQWCDMLKRCNNPNVWNYNQYGGRGITVCERWATSFANFWSDLGPTWAPGLQIERNDVNGCYDPDNCSWLDAKGQCRNRRSTRWVESPWGRISLAEAADRSGIPWYTIRRRLDRGLPMSETFATR